MIFNIFLPLLLTLTTVSSLCTNETKCTTAVCNEIAKKFEGSIDTKRNPCDHFYYYVCYHWERTQNPEDQRALDVSNFYVTLKEVVRRLIYTLNNRHGITENSVELNKMYNLYKGCLDQDFTHIEKSIKLLRKAVKKIGGCPFLGQPLDSNFDVANALAILMKEYAIDDAIFSLSTAQVKSKVGGKATFIPHIKLSGPSLTYEFRYEQRSRKINFAETSLKKYIKNTFFRRMGIKMNVSDFDQQIEELVSFERQLVKLLSSIDPPRFPELMKLPELQAELGDKVNITKLMKEVYTNVDWNEVHVAVYNMSYMRKVTELIEIYGKKTMANYLSWRIIQSFKKYIPSATPKTEITCAEVLFQNMEVAVAHIYENTYVSQEMRNDIQSIASAVKAALFKAISKSNSLSKTTKESAKAKLKALTVNIGYPNWTKNTLELKNYYENLGNIDRDNFFEGLLRCRKFTAKKKIKYFQLAPTERYEFPLTPFERMMNYVLNGNYLSIPLATLLFPFYQYDLPAWIKFGGIGNDMAREMIHAVDPDGSYFDENGNFLENPWWKEQEIESFNSKRDCLVNQYDDFIMVEKSCMTFKGKYTIYENLADNIAIQVSLEAYDSYVLKFGPDRNRKVLNFKIGNNQAFFLQYAYKYCGSHAYFNEHRNFTSFKFRVLGPLLNSYSFQTAFHCRTGQRMYKSFENMCQVSF